ncbi:putative NADPH-quinone reductase [Friedmanniella endophytica]|uniref:Putative NADPH-quinone reductase n=1 Tax=Microlunatus kandeliicorticis TaxID=1759536 RepID=A0A7W3IS68_9ACTN|nr:NAD(P)H-dependent oxidoreductase [Microlunatus kandeliicorticis]MBA8794273.1 putative NADPH-quinone reductase [Microlunatus kandeliicorticis]
MRLLSPAMVVLGHPRADSFCHAAAARIRATLTEAGARVGWHDLYVEGFDPLLTADESRLPGPGGGARPTADPLVDTHRRELAVARALVVVHPNWWGKPPAVLAGWLDRVLAPGVAYRDHGPTAPIEPLLGVRRLLVVTTTDSPPDRDGAGDPLDLLWRRAVAPTLGGPDVERMVFPQVNAADDDRRRRWLDGAARAAAWVSGAAR